MNFLFGEVVPCGTILMTEAGKQVCTIWLQYTMNLCDKLASFLDGYVMGTSEIKDKIKLRLLERETEEASNQEVHFSI